MRRVSQATGFALLAVVIVVLSCTDLATTTQNGVITVGLSSDVTTLQVGQTVQISASAANLGGGSLPDATFIWASSNQSVATVSPTGLVTAVAPGTTDISATADGKTAFVTVTVVAAATNTLGFSAQPSVSAQSGVAFAQAPAVQLRLGTSPISQSGVTVTADIASGGGTLGGSVTSTTNAAGVATFTNLSISGTVGPRTLTFSAPGFGTLTSATINVTPGVPAVVTMVAQPSASAEANGVFASQPAVQLFDAFTNAITQSGVVVTVSLSSGTGVLNGTKTASTDANGIATFSGLSIDGTGSFTLDFSSSGTNTVTSNAIVVSPPPATSLVFGTPASSVAQSGVAFSQQPTIQLRQGISPLAQAGVVVTAAIATGGGTLGGTATATTNGAGLATFTNLSISGTIGARTLFFSAAGFTPITSGPIAITPGPAAALNIITQPSPTATTGVAFATQPSVQLQDASGNNVGQSSVPVAVSLASGTGTLNGSKTVGTNSSGIATFSGLSITGGGPYTLGFVTSSTPSVESNGITVSAPPFVTTQAVPSVTAIRGTAMTSVTPVTASGGTLPYLFGIAPALPAGLSMNTGTGRISGTATVTLATTTFTVTVTDSASVVSSKTFSLTVNPPALVTTQAVPTVTATQNVAISAVTPVTASAGTAPYTFGIAPALPAGLSLNTSNGQITGTPTGTLSTTAFTVTVTDAAALTSSKNFSLTVNAPPALATTQAVPNINTVQNAAMAAVTPVTASGGTAPYSFAVAPALPAGVSMSTTTGQITGTPTATMAATTFTVTVTDAAAATSSKTFSLTVVSTAQAALYPNLPAGLTHTSEIDFTQSIPTGNDQVDQLIPGQTDWYFIRYGTNWIKTSDANAPQTAPGIWQGHWAPGAYGGGIVGQGGGSGIGDMFTRVMQPGATKQLYVSMRLYFDFNANQWHPISNKWLNVTTDKSQILMQIKESSHWRHPEELSFTSGSWWGDSDNVPGENHIGGQLSNVAVPNRQWVHIEVFIDLTNKVYKVWQDGVLTNNLSPPFVGTEINEVGIYNFRGGGGETITSDLYYRYDHFFLAWQ